MNVTPTDPMYRAMNTMADVFCGEAPLSVEISPAAMKRRERREIFMSLMHTFVAMTMREGVRRFCEERGMPTNAAPMKNAPH